MKKINKYTASAMVALCIMMMGFGISSCTNKYDYDGASPETGAQVYFPETSKDISLSENQNSFVVSLFRQNTGESASVPVVLSDESGLFSVAGGNTVNFAAGEASTYVEVKFNFDEIQADTDYPMSISLADASQGTIYGASAVNVNVKYAPWSEWTPWEEGTGTYTYKQFFSGDDVGLQIFYREFMVEGSNKAQFRIDNWGGGISLLVNYNTATNTCEVPDQFIGYTHDSYGDVWVVSSHLYNPTKFPEADNLSYYEPVAGQLVLNVVYYVDAGYFGQGPEVFQCDGFYVPDYDISFNYEGAYKDKSDRTGAIINMSKGVDVNYFKYTVLKGEYDSEDFPYIIDDTTLTFVQSEEGGYKFIPLEEDGKYTIVAGSYDAEDELKGIYGMAFNYESPGGAKWETYGMCSYTDDLIGPLFSAPPVTYDVEVRTKADKPGVYRMVNPYGAAFPYNEEGDWDDSQDWFIDINASNPNEVWIDEQLTGCDWGYGNMFIGCLATGTLADNKITFPTKGMYVGFDESMYYANTNGAFCLDLTPANAKSAKNSAKHSKLATKKVKGQRISASKKSYRSVKTRVQNMSFEQYMKVATLKQ